MLLVMRNKNIYDLGVGISTVFEKCGHFLFKGRVGPLCTVMIYIPSKVT
jgi:hypothetical protein